MTHDQFKKAESIEKEKLSVMSIIEDIRSCRYFNRHLPHGDRGLRQELKPSYEIIVDALKARIKELESELSNL
jgi:hypothetical protein